MSSGAKYWNGKRWIGGGAAQLHRIKEEGGWDMHHQNFARFVVQEYNKFLSERTLYRVK